MSEELTYALLIDAENISSKYIKIVLDELSNYGTATYRRIYGDWTNLSNAAWKDVLLNYSVNPVQQYSYTQGKNASDSAMIIDAMDILYSGNVGGFCIVSSDSDFTRLASRLRESGKHVIGMGESKTPSAFISACNLFKYLDILYSSSDEEKYKEKELVKVQVPARASRKKPAAPRVAPPKNGKPTPVKTPEPERQSPSGGVIHSRTGILTRPESESWPEPQSQIKLELEPEPQIQPQPQIQAKPEPQVQAKPEPQTKLNTIKRSIRAIITEGSNEDGWISASKIGNQLAKRFPDFDVRNYGYSKLNQFVESLGEFEMDQISPSKDSKVQHIYFRVKNNKKPV